MATEFTFRIAGSYSPATIPLERLGEYMAALGQLFGEQANVHFGKLSEGSTVVHLKVGHPAVPKVERRIRKLAAGEGTKRASKAYERLDEMLFEDNASGEIKSSDSNVILVDFVGCKRVAPMVYGPVKQHGVIDGEVFRIEGRDSTIHVGVLDRDKTYSLTAPAQMASELAPLFRNGVTRFSGEGTWMRHGPNNWELKKFRIQSAERLTSESVIDAVKDLRDIGLGDWAKSDDPVKRLLDERRGGKSEH